MSDEVLDTEESNLPLLSDALAILDCDDVETAYVDVPQWKGRVKVKSLRGDQASALHAIGKDQKRNKEFLARLIVVGAIKEDGSPLFNKDMVEPLSKRSFAALNKIAGKILELSGMNEEQGKNLEKDSGSTVEDGLPSV